MKVSFTELIFIGCGSSWNSFKTNSDTNLNVKTTDKTNKKSLICSIMSFNLLQNFFSVCCNQCF